jgi:hypothetical protein
MEGYLQDPSNPNRPTSDSKPYASKYKTRFGEGRHFKPRYDNSKPSNPTTSPFRSHTIHELLGESTAYADSDSDTELAAIADFTVCQLANVADDSKTCGICAQSHPFGECPALTNTCYMRHFVSASQRHHKKLLGDLKRYEVTPSTDVKTV